MPTHRQLRTSPSAAAAERTGASGHRPPRYNPAVLVQALPSDVLFQLVGAASWPPDEANAVVEMTGPGTRALLLTFGVVERFRRDGGQWSIRLTDEGCAFLAALGDGTLMPPAVRPVSDHGPTAPIARVLPAAQDDKNGRPPPLTGFFELWPVGDATDRGLSAATVKVERDGASLRLWQTAGSGAVVEVRTGHAVPRDGAPLVLDAGELPPPTALRSLLALSREP